MNEQLDLNPLNPESAAFDFQPTQRRRVVELLHGMQYVNRVRELQDNGAEFFRVKCLTEPGSYEVQCDVPASSKVFLRPVTYSIKH